MSEVKASLTISALGFAPIGFPFESGWIKGGRYEIPAF